MMTKAEIEANEGRTVEVTHYVRRPGGDPVIKKVIGRIEGVWGDHFTLSDPVSDIAESVPIYYDRAMEIELLPTPFEAADLIARSWEMMTRLPISGTEAVDHIIKLTQLLEVLTAPPVADQ